jgi:hypothetical protein
MIQGLQIDVSSTELKEHIQGRAKHHKEKAEWYEKQVRNLKEGGVTESMASNDPTSSLQRSAEEHRQKFGFFSFMADHIVPNETYRLTEHDLSRLEFVSRYY